LTQQPAETPEAPPKAKSSGPETPEAPQKTDTPEELYLDLLKQVLTRSGFTSYGQPGGYSWKRFFYNPLQAFLKAQGLRLVKEIAPQDRTEGRDFPDDAETMVGRLRLDSLQTCIRQLISDNVPGDLIETGVWRGGASIFMRAVLKAYGDTGRTVWVADSFQGLPKAGPGRRPSDPGDQGDQLWKLSQLAVSMEQVQANFARYGLLDEQVRFLPGWFKDTLPGAPIGSLALLRLDGDMFESTMVALESLYPKVSPGGYVVVDDYRSFDGCRQATDRYRAAMGITEPIVEIDWTGVYWRRESDHKQ
jgi:O-methyltransferase